MKSKEFIKKMPKTELHLHLEGAIPVDFLFKLIKRDRSNPSIKTPDDLKEVFKYKDFDHFIITWGWKNSFIKKEEDFLEIAYEVLKKLSDQNVKYAEAFYSPGDFMNKGLTVQGITEYLIEGKEKARRDFNIKCNLIIDLIRDHGPEEGMKRLDEVTPYLGKGVIGIGIGGSEGFFPPEPYEAVYKEAKKRGFRLTAHGGEAAGPESVWGAINKLGVERIGHGVRAIEDTKLIKYLKEKQIPLEVCPVSNIKTGIYKSIEEHPIKEFFREGLMVTVNSDDPEMFNTSITEEYLILAEELAFSPDDIKKLSFNSIEASFLEEKDKELMKKDFEREWNKIWPDFCIY